MLERRRDVGLTSPRRTQLFVPSSWLVMFITSFEVRLMGFPKKTGQPANQVALANRPVEVLVEPGKLFYNRHVGKAGRLDRPRPGCATAENPLAPGDKRNTARNWIHRS